MSETQKTILIAGGVVVGAFLLMKVIAPPPAVVKGPTASTSGLSGLIGNIAAIGGAAASIFGGSGKTPNDGTYHADTSGFSISGNTLVDDSGNTVTYGAGY